MLARFLTISIIGFWLAMTGLLLRSIWFPADSRLAVVSPGAVFQLIGARGDPSTLDIYDDRKVIGHVSIQTTSLGLSQRKRIKLRMTGRIRLGQSALAGTELEIRSWAEIEHNGEVAAFSLELLAGNSGTFLRLAQADGEASPQVHLEKNGKVLLDTAGITEQNSRDPFLSVMLGALGIAMPDLETLREQAGKQAEEIELEARQGKFDLKGTTRQGYILRMGLPGRAGFRLCVENTGEIVQLETPSSFYFLTESLRPPDAPFP